MPKTSALFAVCFVAGLMGALSSSLLLWFGGEWGLFRLLGINFHQGLSLSSLYAPLFTGGLWGLAYFFAVASLRTRRHWIRKGLWLSLIPALVNIFYIYPQIHHQGLGGINLGVLMPGLIFVTWLIWGFFTGFFARLFWGR